MSFTADLLQRWGEILRETRRSQGLSLEALANRAGVDTTHLSKAERGLAGFGDDARIRIAVALEKRVSDLFPYPDTTQEPECLPAANAAAEGTSLTRPTTGETPSPARSAAAPAASARGANPGPEAS